MPDRGTFWSPVPDWPGATIAQDGLRVTASATQAAWLVSGNLPAFLEHRGGLPCVGPRETCDPQTYALRLAPDRLLFVANDAENGLAVDFGWSEDGFAVSDVSDGFVLFDVMGPAALDLMKQGADYAFEAKVAAPAESALMVFGGLKVAVAKLNDGWRLHVERPHATAMWQWLQQAASTWAKPPAAA